MTLKGTGKAYDRTVTLTDREFGDKKNITVKMIDEPFLEIQTKRYFIKGGFSTKEYGKIEKDGVRERVTVSSLGTTWPFKGKPVSGFRISFAGGREEGGPKDTPVLKSINAVGTEENAPTISNVRIIQVKDGWYWIKFREDGMDVDSYMVVQE